MKPKLNPCPICKKIPFYHKAVGSFGEYEYVECVRPRCENNEKITSFEGQKSAVEIWNKKHGI